MKSTSTLNTATRFLPLILLIYFTGCACRARAPIAIDSIQTRGWVSFYRQPLELRLSRPKDAANSDVLVVYATGDGGWRGLDEDIFKWICAWNYPAVGFSSKGYLKNLGYIGDTTTPRRLVADFKTIIQFAEQKLEMRQSTRIVLVGLSRGAGLAVVAAGQGELKPDLAGVLAIALTKEEEHVVHYRRRRAQPGQPKQELLVIQTYEYLPRIDSVPVMVIQSTNDGYLPAGAARALFGPDTEMKKLLPINARNHGFSGGCFDLYSGTKSGLDWIYGFRKTSILHLDGNANLPSVF
jgi:dienelactone hydrolase